MKNNTFEEIAGVLSASEKVLIFPHVNMDGDALGSAAALCRGLRKIGKECYVLIEDDIPFNLEFLDKGYCTKDKNIIAHADVSVCVDCGDTGRFEKRKEKFAQAPVSVCIDHHATTEFFCEVNYVEPAAAATGELIFRLLKTMGIEIDCDIAESLYAAITTDTGNFQYSNTTVETHLIAVELCALGINPGDISIEIYENARIEKLLLEAAALRTMTTLSGGKGVIAYVTQEMLKETGARSDETEGIVQKLRSIAGVEVAALMKETDDGRIKVSMRSKKYVDVAEIAAGFSGGGHVRAAGCTFYCGLTEAFDKLKEKITDSLEI